MVNLNIHIPKKSNKEKRWIKCSVEGCESVFYAYPNTRFCNHHKNINTRINKIIEKETFFEINDRFSKATLIELICKLCGKPYRVILYPLQNKYPMYCEEHRNKFKRDNYKKKGREYFGTSYE